jgi:hypothetical protein
MVIDGVKGTVSAAADMLTRKRRPSAEEPTFAQVLMRTPPTAVVCYFSTPSPDCGAVSCRAVGTWRCGCQGYDRQEGKPPECCFPAAICRDNKAPGDVLYVSSNQPDSAFTQCCRSSRGVPALRAHWIVQAVSCVANIRSYRVAQDTRVIDTVEYPPSPSLKPAIPLFPLPFLPPFPVSLQQHRRAASCDVVPISIRSSPCCAAGTRLSDIVGVVVHTVVNISKDTHEQRENPWQALSRFMHGRVGKDFALGWLAKIMRLHSENDTKIGCTYRVAAQQYLTHTFVSGDTHAPTAVVR